MAKAHRRLPKQYAVKTKETRQESFLLKTDKKTKAKARTIKAKIRGRKEAFKKTTLTVFRGERSGRFGKKA
jgi:hypothetical protein